MWGGLAKGTGLQSFGEGPVAELLLDWQMAPLPSQQPLLPRTSRRGGEGRSLFGPEPPRVPAGSTGSDAPSLGLALVSGSILWFTALLTCSCCIPLQTLLSCAQCSGHAISDHSQWVRGAHGKVRWPPFTATRMSSWTIYPAAHTEEPEPFQSSARLRGECRPKLRR